MLRSPSCHLDISHWRRPGARRRFGTPRFRRRRPGARRRKRRRFEAARHPLTSRVGSATSLRLCGGDANPLADRVGGDGRPWSRRLPRSSASCRGASRCSCCGPRSSAAATRTSTALASAALVQPPRHCATWGLSRVGTADTTAYRGHAARRPLQTKYRPPPTPGEENQPIGVGPENLPKRREASSPCTPPHPVSAVIQSRRLTANPVVPASAPANLVAWGERAGGAGRTYRLGKSCGAYVEPVVRGRCTRATAASHPWTAAPVGRRRWCVRRWWRW